MIVFHAAEVFKGGVGTVLSQLIDDQIKREKIDTLIALIPSGDIDGKMFKKRFHDKIYIYEFKRKKRSICSLVMFGWMYLYVLAKHRPNIVHLHSTFAGVLGRALYATMYCIGLRSKIIYCPHAFAFMMTGSRLRTIVYKSIEKFFVPMTNYIICVSHYELDLSKKYGVGGEKLRLIYNGVNAEFDKSSKSYCCDKESDNTPVSLLFVGRLTYQKGFDVLLSAINSLDPSRFELVVVGDGDICDRKTAKNNISYSGWLNGNELDSAYEQADVVIVPSRWEGFAMVPLEAMKHYKPIVASNSTSLPEAVIHGVNGYLFASGDSSSLQNIITSMSRKNFRKMGIAGHDLLIKKFSSSNMCNSVFELYVN